jgi:NADPH-dependent F420 reductase
VLTVGILGGTGPQGRGLGRRLAVAGHPVVLGSRSAERAAAAAAGIGVDGLTGGHNERAAAADLVVVTVPYDGHAGLLAPLAPRLAGKIVVDCVNPIGFDARGPYALAVPDGSAAEEAQRLLPGATVIAAFHHVSAVRLEDPTVGSFDEDVLVLGEDREAVGVVIGLAAAALPGGRGVFAGRLRNAGQVEALTANLIAVNRRYKTHAGLRITDLP